MDAWFDELAGFIRIPSVSADPAQAGEVERAGRVGADFIRGAGGEGGGRAGRRTRSRSARFARRTAASAPTVMCYGHFDVQPPEPLELWESDPFEPESATSYLYARGVVDDKGQLYTLLRGARELALAGELPVNVRFCCDGEEEVGGHSIVDFLAADERGADAAVIFDSDMIRRGLPAFTSRRAASATST